MQEWRETAPTRAGNRELFVLHLNTVSSGNINR
jgi:hypothetical protein